MLRVRDIPQAPGDGGDAKVAVLFSGGIDSTMLAFLAHRYAKTYTLQHHNTANFFFL